MHLGDYIYETAYDQYFCNDFETTTRRADCENVMAERKRVRWLAYDRPGKIETLSQFRRRYDEYKRDPRLQ